MRFNTCDKSGLIYHSAIFNNSSSTYPIAIKNESQEKRRLIEPVEQNNGYQKLISEVWRSILAILTSISPSSTLVIKLWFDTLCGSKNKIRIPTWLRKFPRKRDWISTSFCRDLEREINRRHIKTNLFPFNLRYCYDVVELF